MNMNNKMMLENLPSQQEIQDRFFKWADADAKYKDMHYNEIDMDAMVEEYKAQAEKPSGGKRMLKEAACHYILFKSGAYDNECGDDFEYEF